MIELSKNNDFDLIGINYKDEPSDAMNWLSMRGNPYKIIISDLNGDLSMNLGVYGVPETYIVNENQTIIYKHIGPLTKTIIKNEMEPLLRKKNEDYFYCHIIYFQFQLHSICPMLNTNR